MTIDELNVRISICENILRRSRLNEIKTVLDELYDKSPYFRDMVDSYDDDHDNDATPREIVFGNIMIDLEKQS